jgi:DNA primase
MTRLSDELRQSLEAAAVRYHSLLGADLPAQNYLHGRGIKDSAIGAFRLGVVDGAIAEHAWTRPGW